MTFDSTATKQIYETRDATFAKDFEGVSYTYRIRSKGAAKQFLVTVQSSPLIPDGELALYFRRFGVVENVRCSVWWLHNPRLSITRLMVA